MRISSTATAAIAWISRRPQWSIVAVCGVIVAVLGFLDAFTGPDLSILTFYFLPVLLSTWFVGRFAGLLVSAGSAVEWVAADMIASPGHMAPVVSVWNAAIHFGFFIFVVWTMGQLKESLERQEHAERARIEREIETAREVQNALVPRITETGIRGFEVSASCEPARGIAGDIYDFMLLDDRRLLLAVGDVSGKGIAAALLGASLLAGLRSLAPLYPGRVDLLTNELNRLIHTETITVRYATFFVAEYDFTASRLRWVNAGHTSPLLFRRGSPDPERLLSNGTVVGLFPGRQWSQQESALGAGDLLVLYSDGLSETRDESENELGEEGIIGVVAHHIGEPVAAIHAALVEAAMRFSGGRPLIDDQTLVVLRRGDAAVRP